LLAPFSMASLNKEARHRPPARAVLQVERPARFIARIRLLGPSLLVSIWIGTFYLNGSSQYAFPSNGAGSNGFGGFSGLTLFKKGIALRVAFLMVERRLRYWVPLWV
jgi:hypothetical protein